MTKPCIASDPTIMMGKPVIAGTRITLDLIVEKLAAGETVDSLLVAHPRLTRDAIQAAVTFAEEASKTVQPDVEKADSFLNVALSSKLDGPPDWATNFEECLYGEKSQDDEPSKTAQGDRA